MVDRLIRRRRNGLGACLIFALTLQAHEAHAEAPYTIEWIRQLGSHFTDVGYGVATDVNDNIYMTGYTDGDLGGFHSGSSDAAILAKFNPAGNQLFLIQDADIFGEKIGRSVVVGPGANDIYYTGAHNGGGMLTKFNSWSRDINSPATDDSYGVALDKSGNVYAAGWTIGDIGGPNAGGSDAVLSKYDASGNLLWARQFGTHDSDQGRAVVVDSAGNAYLAGISATSSFLMKYDSAGNVLWNKPIGAGGLDAATSLAIDSSDNVYVGGSTEGSLGGQHHGFVGFDAFLLKFNPAGNLLWSGQVGAPDADDLGFAVAVDPAGNAYLAGTTAGSITGAQNHFVDNDAFLVKYNSTGQLLWTQQFGTPGEDYCYGMAVDSKGNAYLTGSTFLALVGTNQGLRDTYLAKLSSPVPEPPSAWLFVAGWISCAIGIGRRRMERFI